MIESEIATPPARLNPRLQSIVQIVGVVLAVLVGLYIYQYVTRGAFWKSTFERYASEKAGRPVRVAGRFELYLDPNIRFRGDGLSVANPEWAETDQFFTTRRIAVDASLWRALFGTLTFDDLSVEGGRLALQRRTDKTNTWTFGGGELEVPDILRAAITDSHVDIIDAPSKTRVTLTVGDIAGAATGTRGRIDGPLVFAGTGTSAGAPFEISGRLTTPNAAAAGGRVGLDLNGTIARTAITVKGTLPGATRIDGADLNVTIKGRNFQDPWALFGIALPATRPYALAATVTKAGREYRVTRMTGRIGDTDMAGSLTATLAEAPGGRFRIDGALASKVLDIKDVGPLVGYDPVKLDAGAPIVTTVAGRPRLLPDAPLAIDGLAKFDAHITYRAATVRTGKLLFDRLRLDFDLDDRNLTLSPLAFNVVGGRVIANIGIAARTLPVRTDYDIRLTGLPLGKVLTGFDVEDAGTTATIRGRMQLTGSGDTVHTSLATASGRIAFVVPKGQLWVRNIELGKLDLQKFLVALVGRKLKEPKQINCGVVAFTVTNGRAVADPITIDTDSAVFTGRGSFDFGDEALAMSLEGDSKRFSLFSGQSPIGIGGFFADPSINPISGELIGRAAAGLALGVIASPVAAIAAFVDVGDAKDVDCTPILAARRGARGDRASNARAKT